MLEQRTAINPRPTRGEHGAPAALSGINIVQANEDYPPERITRGDFMRVDFDAIDRPGDALYLIEVCGDHGVWSGIRRFGRQPHLQVKEDGVWADFSPERFASTRFVGRVLTVYRSVDLTLENETEVLPRFV